MDLFAAQVLPAGVTLLRAVARESAFFAAVEDVIARAPLRNMVTPRGPMSVSMTNCGDYGWVSDANGYRYSPVDPLTGEAWPAMPEILKSAATDWAERAGFPSFVSNACLVNQYVPGTQMGLHQDKDEQDITQPIVSVSLGLPATFTIGGSTRNEPKRDLTIEHGDVVVFGGPARRMYHGIKRIPPGTHAVLGARRINVTFRYTRPS